MSRRLAALLAANLAAAIGLLYTAGFIPVVSARTAPPMLLIAHRGDMANHPENTIAAFLAASRLGADGIEMDVWRSSAGTWWVMHDPTVDRTTDGTGRISELNDTELEALRVDAGAGYGTADTGDHVVPRLEEAIEALRTYEGLIYVHLKEHGDDAAIQLAWLLEDHDAALRTTVIVPSVQAARAIKATSDELRTLVLRDGLGIPETDPAVDGWLTTERRIIRPGLVSDRPYAVEVYASADDGIWDERSSLQRANRFNVRAYITNDIRAALNALGYTQLAGIRSE